MHRDTTRIVITSSSSTHTPPPVPIAMITGRGKLTVVTVGSVKSVVVVPCGVPGVIIEVGEFVGDVVAGVSGAPITNTSITNNNNNIYNLKNDLPNSTVISGS